jgi:tellurite resistance protein
MGAEAPISGPADAGPLLPCPKRGGGETLLETTILPWYARVPVNAFGAVLGLAGLGLLWRQSVFAADAAPAIALVLLALAGVAFVTLAAAYVAKCVRFPAEVARDAVHPVRHAYFGTISMSLLLFAAAAQPDAPGLARVLWLSGAILHFALAVACAGVWLGGRYALDQVSPAWLIPSVGGILAPIASPPPAANEISWLMFAVPMTFGVAILVLNFIRLAFRPPLPPPVIPTVAILLAPPGLLLLAWLRLDGGAVDPLARGLYYAGVTLTIVLVAWIPRFAAVPFSLAWWNYTFPVAAMSTAAMEFHRHVEGSAFAVIAVAYFALANIVIFVVCYRSVVALLGGRLLPRE